MSKTCKYFGKCGGCQTPNLDYPAQLSLKMRKMISVMGRMCHVDEIVGMEDPYHYRNKVQAAFGRQSGHTVCGIYQSGSGRIIPAKSCLLEDERATAIRLAVQKLAQEMSLTIYNPKNGRGLLRHVMVRVSRATSQAMVVLVTGTSPFTKARAFTEALLEMRPDITTVVQCINTTDVPLFMDGRETVLYGSGFMEDVIGGIRFRVSAKSFLQINPTQTEKLYGLALENAGLTGKETVLDAYCGVGTMSLLAAGRAKRVIGVEINESAVENAAQNAALNGIRNAEFHAADAGEYMNNLLRQRTKVDVVLVDPPRAGCSENFLKSLIRLAPEKIVYVSCNPDTLGRDAITLRKGGYRVERVTPVDMFPFTTHVESVCLLSKLNAKQHIEINLDMDELDLTDAEKKATYQEIKDYVLEHSGLKVSSLYIAQVKQQCGIIERENYNKPKSEDAKQPQCPPDKEKAIKEALKHFGMI